MPPKAKHPPSNYLVPSVMRAIDMLELLPDQPLSLSEISHQLQIPYSSCFNLLTTLESRGFLRRDPLTNRYSLGWNLMHLGMHQYQNLDLRKAAMPFMNRLVETFEETSYLSVIDHTTFEGIVMDRVQASTSNAMMVMLTVGQKFHPHCSATGKVLLSYLSDTELEVYLLKVDRPRFTERTLISPAEIREEVARIRRQGYGIMQEEMERGVTGVGAPVHNHQGEVIAAISVTGPEIRMRPMLGEVIPAVVGAAREMSQLLGQDL